MPANLRSELRQRRRAIPQNRAAVAADAVARTLADLEELHGAVLVAAYLGSDGELDPAPAVRDCRQRGQRIAFPIVEDDDMSFALHEEGDRLVENRWGISEPTAGERVAVADLDVVLTPLVAFDAACNRMGRGRGYYDRAMAERPRPVLVGLAYELQRVDALEPTPGDVRLDAVVTEERIYRRRGGR